MLKCLVVSVTLILVMCGCRVPEAAYTSIGRAYLQSRPLIDGEVKRLRQKAYTDFSWINCAKFSPDGKYVAASFDKGVTVWDATSGTKLRQFEGHNGDVWDIAFSPDMRFLASSSSDKSVRLWSFDTGKEIRHFPDFQEESRCVCFSPNGEQIAAVGLHSIFLWDTKTGNLIHRFKGLPDDNSAGFYSAVCFSPDGKFLNAIGNEHLFQTWDLQSGALTTPLIHSKNKACFSPRLVRSIDGSRWATGEQQMISVWDGTTGNLLKSWHPNNAINGWAIAISSNGRMAVHASQFITIWDIETGEEIWQRQTPLEVDSVNFSPDDKFLVTGARDGSVRIWKAPTISR